MFLSEETTVIFGHILPNVKHPLNKSVEKCNRQRTFGDKVEKKMYEARASNNNNYNYYKCCQQTLGIRERQE